jgi:hypothetical protein
MRTDKNWAEYRRMMNGGELDYFKGKGYYGAFTNGRLLYIMPTEQELKEKLNEDGVKGETMTQLIGGGIQTATFRRSKRVMSVQNLIKNLV